MSRAGAEANPLVRVRAMEAEDVPQVAELDRRCATLPWSEGSFLGEIRSAVGYYRVAEREGRLVGYLGANLILDEAHVTTLGTDPGFRRQGIAERLLVEFLSHAIGAGCRRITLEVRVSNEPAIGLYRKYYFAPVSKRKAYYSDNQEDALVMWIEDTGRYSFRMLLQERAQLLLGEP
jgi:ribosomal-protein-alanine N-acetyltransferase